MLVLQEYVRLSARNLEAILIALSAVQAHQREYGTDIHERDQQETPHERENVCKLAHRRQEGLD